MIKFIKLTEEEKEIFEKLKTKYERQKFKEDFISKNQERIFVADDKFIGKEYEFTILEDKQ